MTITATSKSTGILSEAHRRVLAHRPAGTPMRVVEGALLSVVEGRASARRHLEGGSAEGEFAFMIYTPYLFALLLVGLAFALVGFWRIGATMSAERAAAANGVSPQGSNASVARAAQQLAFDTWADARGGAVELTAGPGQRSDTLTFSARATLRTGFLGNWEFSLPGQSERRRERFYSGPAVCETEANCHE